jgi:hypothetical protein
MDVEFDSHNFQIDSLWKHEAVAVISRMVNVMK